MKSSLSAALIVAAFSLAAAGKALASPDWAAVTAAATALRDNPTPAASRRLLGLLPYERAQPPEPVFDELWGLVDTIARRGFAGDVDAIRVGFRLRLLADAAFSEDLAVCLGSIATVQPRAFLSALVASQREVGSSTELLDVVARFDPDLSEPEQATERQKRLKALAAVRDHRFRAVRDASVKRLSDTSPVIP